MFDFLRLLNELEEKPDRIRAHDEEQAERADQIAEMQARMQIQASDPPLMFHGINVRSDDSVGTDTVRFDLMGSYRIDSFGPYSPSMGEPIWSNARQLQVKPQSAVAVVEEPSRSMLQRAQVDVQDLDLNDPRQKLATDAEALLGYTPLREELRTPGRLKRALAQLEMEILDWKSVTAYKKQMAAHYETAGKMREPTWRLTKLKEYKYPVPEFVLQKAVEIKKLLPEAEFYVEQLAVDPFLIVSLAPLNDFVSIDFSLKRIGMDPETSAYVEVWSEPKFEATM